jgi:hypothetical protein
MKNIECCKELAKLLADSVSPLLYTPHTRTYELTVPRFYWKDNELYMHFVIRHCPYCGTIFPKDLTDVWADILEKEYNITLPYDEDKDHVPREFMTDEWWKKRGL